MRAWSRLTGVAVALAAWALAAPAGAFAASDLVLTMTASPDPVKVGELLTYELFVTNAGPDASDGVTVTDSLPAGLDRVSAVSTRGTCQAAQTVACALGTLPPGESAIVTIQARPTGARTLVNTATVSAGSPDPAAENNSATVAVQAQPDRPVLSRLSLTKRVFRVGRGTTLAFSSSEAVTVTFRVQRRIVRAGQVRWRAAARPFRRRANAGPNRIGFSGRVRTSRGVRALRPGRYRIRARATDADGNRSALRSARFRIVR
jgi:uncharacterized repeat protein (TIGR01451 family)